MNLKQKLREDVKEFRDAFGLEINSLKLSDSDKSLHDSLIKEEFAELIDADNRTDKIDAIVDAVYVLIGQQVHSQLESMYKVDYFIDILISMSDVLSFDFEEAWDIVHESNMSKPCISRDEAMISKVSYESLGYEVEIDYVGEFHIVKNKNDVTLPGGKFVKAGKALKSINYKPADLSAL